jgi:hypothetical protein
VHDDDCAWRGQVHLELRTFAGEAVAAASLDLDVPPRFVIELGLVES